MKPGAKPGSNPDMKPGSNPEVLRKRLERAQQRVATLEKMIEDKTRALFLSNQSLQEANDYLTDLYRVMPGALLVVDSEGRIKRANRAAIELLRPPALSGRPIVGEPVVGVFPGFSRHLASVRAQGARRSEQSWRTLDGAEIPVLVSLVPVQADDLGPTDVVCVGLDLTERKQLEIELRHAQKLESIGQLAAGVAHEINSPMQFIGDNTEFVAEAFSSLARMILIGRDTVAAIGSGGDVRACADRWEQAFEEEDLDFVLERMPVALSRTQEGIKRVTQIVAAMKAFAHPQDERAPADINEAIENTLTVCANEYKYVAQVEKDLQTLPAVHCHLGEINQVLLNLVVNAAHAIEAQRTQQNEGCDFASDPASDSASGRIAISSRHLEGWVVVAVSDNGCGIPQDITHRIFDPFFTTKEVGKGTGQGLSLVHNIVKKHGGDLRFETEVGRGTTFTVRLPLAANETSLTSGTDSQIDCKEVAQ